MCSIFSFTMIVISSALAFGQVTNRIQGQIGDGGSFALTGNIPSAVAHAQDQGAVAPSRTMPRMSIHFALTAAQSADLQELLNQQQNPSSAQYHHWLSPQQYA